MKCVKMTDHFQVHLANYPDYCVQFHSPNTVYFILEVSPHVLCVFVALTVGS